MPNAVCWAWQVTLVRRGIRVPISSCIEMVFPGHTIYYPFYPGLKTRGY